MLNLTPELDQAHRAIKEAQWEIEYHQTELNAAIREKNDLSAYRHEIMVSIWRDREAERKATYLSLLQAVSA